MMDQRCLTLQTKILVTDGFEPGQARKVIVFLCVLKGKPPDSNGWFQILDIQMILHKINGPQNKTKNADVGSDFGIGR